MKKLFLISTALLFFAANALAVPIQAPWTNKTPEWNLYEVYNYLFGTNLTNANLNSRVVVNDQLWLEYNGGVKIQSTYAGYTQNLWDALPDGTFQTQLITNYGTDGINTAFSATGTNFAPGQEFQWVGAPSTGGPFYSNQALNLNGEDHFVSIMVRQAEIDYFNSTFGGGLTHGEGLVWFLGFEDRSAGADWDFNDLAFIAQNVAPVPEPLPMMLFGSGLLGCGFYLRKKFIKK